eukprot:TRINITY_DN31560_c0_g2_i3.p2 TRINITY_DN31560_c0_g2~~TRINITY_DN31560_c0_g2_i3.p2  ORF type:complete len:156 (+),score=29.31 TRINITY_DN31560_c0_g2_i3:116-583(+)
MYPTIGYFGGQPQQPGGQQQQQQQQQGQQQQVRVGSSNGPSQPAPPPPMGSAQSGPLPLLTVKVANQYAITKPVEMPSTLENPYKSDFQYDFETERKIVAELSQDSYNGSDTKVEIVDPYMKTYNNYVSMGYDKEGIGMALAVYRWQRHQPFAYE